MHLVIAVLRILAKQFKFACMPRKRRVPANKHRRDRACIVALEAMLTDAVRANPSAAQPLFADRVSEQGMP